MPTEKELTAPVPLAINGAFNPASHGWARQPGVIDTSMIASTWSGWGRNKRWEYWCIITPDHIIAVVAASIDFICPLEVWIFDRKTNETIVGANAIGLPGSSQLAPTAETGPTRAKAGGIKIDIDEEVGGTRIKATAPRVELDILASLPKGHERLAVVVPWSDNLYQFTLKDVSRPASGSFTVDGKKYDIPKGSWAILDHGRGRWPHDIEWNWAAGSGRLSDGRVVGLQMGAQWTDNTGSTENAVLVGTTLHKISDNLEFTYDKTNFLSPWHVKGGGLEATLTPFFNKHSEAGASILLGNRADQVFGIWKGKFDTGKEVVEFDNVVGFAEDVHQLW